MSQTVTINVRMDVRDALGFFSRLEREQAPFATALALTTTAKRAEADVVKTIKQVFDRPTRFTRNSTYVKVATKRNLTSEVGIKDAAFKADAPIRWLAPQIYGGPRGPKRSEYWLRDRNKMPGDRFAIPTKELKRDAYGNVSKGDWVRVLSRVGALGASLQNESARSKKRRKGRGPQYFALPERRGKLPPGIYERRQTGFGSLVRAVVLYGKQPKYTKRLPFQAIVQRGYDRYFREEFDKAMRQAIATARTPGAPAAAMPIAVAA